jgi:hypothetical protein
LTISFKNKFLLITVSAVLIELLLIIFNIYNGGGNMPFYIFIYFEVFFLFAVGLYIIKSKQPKEETQFTPPVSLPVLIIITGIIFRTTLLPAVPTTSPDVYRYVWEGKVIVNGYNPYKSFPNAPELVPYRSELWGKVGFKNMPAIYPPLAQGSFVIGYLISREAFSVWGIKIVYLICEIFTLVFLLKLLRLKKINPAYIILYAWLPIPLMEYFINAHIDALGISFLVLFLYNIEKGRLNLSAVFLALSFLSKFYPLMLFPLLLRKTGIKKLIPFTLFFLSITILFYLPFITRDFAVKDALSMYISRWEFNGSVYNLIKLFSDGEKARIISTFLLLVTIAVISVWSVVIIYNFRVHSISMVFRMAGCGKPCYELLFGY